MEGKHVGPCFIPERSISSLTGWEVFFIVIGAIGSALGILFVMSRAKEWNIKWRRRRSAYVKLSEFDEANLDHDVDILLEDYNTK